MKGFLIQKDPQMTQMTQIGNSKIRNLRADVKAKIPPSSAGPRLHRELDLLIQELRRKVCAVWPEERAEFRMHRKLPEDSQILQGLEHLPI
jgi:hypothetical protein